MTDKIKAAVAISMSILGFVLSLVELMHQPNILQAFQDIGEAVLATYQTTFKALSLVFARERLQVLIAKVSKFKNTTALEDERHGFEAIHDKMDKVFKVYFLTMIGTLLGIITAALTASDKALPFPMYDFANLKESPQYELAFSWGSATWAIVAFVAGGWDIMFYSLVTYIYCEFEIVKREFQNLKISDDDVWEKFASNLRRHQLVLSCIPDLNAITSTTFLHQIVTTTVAICASLYILVSGGLDFPHLIAQLFFTSAGICQLFFTSFACSQLTDQSQSVAISIFHASFWLDAPIKMKKEIVMITRRSQRYEALTMGGMRNIDLPLFTDVTKFCVSFINAILVFESRK